MFLLLTPRPARILHKHDKNTVRGSEACLARLYSLRVLSRSKAKTGGSDCTQRNKISHTRCLSNIGHLVSIPASPPSSSTSLMTALLSRHATLLTWLAVWYSLAPAKRMRNAQRNKVIRVTSPLPRITSKE